MAGGNLGNNIDELISEIKDSNSLIKSLNADDSNLKSLAQSVTDLYNYLSGGHITSTQQLPPTGNKKKSKTQNNVGNASTSGTSPLQKIEDILKGILLQVSDISKTSKANKTEDLLKGILSKKDLKKHNRALKEQTKLEDDRALEKVKLERAKDTLRKKNITKDERKDALKKLKDNEDGEKRLQRRLKYGNGRWAAYGISGIEKGISSVAKGIKADDIIGGISSGLSKLGPWGAAAGGLLQAAKALFDLYAKQDKITSEYVREIGGGRTGKVGMNNTMGNFLNERATWTNGFDAEIFGSSMKEYASAIGRDLSKISFDSIESAINLKRFNIAGDSIRNFDTFGKSLRETDKYFAKLYGDVSKKGLSFKNVSQEVNKNLKMAQTHTFATGLKGLEKMAERSTQLKYNMQQVASFADKVSTLEGAIQASATLNVMGGDFAQFGNPMQLLYEGLNDMESLNERMVKMFGGKSYWDSSKQQIDISAFDRQRIKSIAPQLGLSPEEMISLTLNEGKMARIESQINGGVDNTTAEYIKNLAELDEEGNAHIRLNGQDRLVSSLGNEDKEALKNESEAKAARDNSTLGDVWQETMSIGDKLDNILKFLTTKLGAWLIRQIGFGGQENRVYWQNNSKDLIKKYGSKEDAKLAIAMGQEDDNIKKWYGGEENIKYFKENKAKYLGWSSAFGLSGALGVRQHNKKLALDIHNGEYDTKTGTINKGDRDIDFGNNSVSNTQSSSSSNNSNQTSSYIASNSSTNNNNLGVTKVQSNQPTYQQQQYARNEEGRLSVTVGGTIELRSGDNVGYVEVDKWSTAQKDRFFDRIVDGTWYSTYNKIRQYEYKGNNKRTITGA